MGCWVLGTKNSIVNEILKDEGLRKIFQRYMIASQDDKKYFKFIRRKNGQLVIEDRRPKR